MIGEQEIAFDQLKLRNILNAANNLNEIKSAKQYATEYFAHCLNPKGVLMWDPTIDGFIHFREKEAKQFLNEKKIFIIRDRSNQRQYVFNLWNWFYHEYNIYYKLDVNPAKPRVYRDEKRKQGYINRFSGYMYTIQPYNKFDNTIQMHVKTILDHIKFVLCSNKPDQVKYMFGWLSNMINGKKMKTAMFLHSGQGTGKSIITNFIREKVLGLKITHKTANEKIIIGNFNKELEGKVLLILEEMSGSKTGDWIAFASRLKDFIDNEQLIIEEKCKTPYSVTNIVSLIINSNNSKAVKLDIDDRRYFIPDISDQYVGNREYFDKLINAMNFPKVGEAFYSLMSEWAKQPFDERIIPKASTKQMMLSEAIHSVHIFIKEHYLVKIGEPNEISSELYNKYKLWHKENVSNSKKPCGIQEFSKKMREIGVVAKQVRFGGSRNMRFQITRNELYNTYKKKGWIDELENINEHTKEINTNICNDNDDEQKVIKQHNTNIQQSNIQKIPPKIPPKPDQLKVKFMQYVQSKQSSSINNQQNVEEEEQPNMLYGEILEKLYNDTHKNWIQYNNDPEDFDWECFMLEVEEIKNITKDGSVFINHYNVYKQNLEKIIEQCREAICEATKPYSKNPNIPTYSFLIKLLEEYGRVREIQFITPPEGYKTTLIHSNPDILIPDSEDEDESDNDWDEFDIIMENNTNS